jgi:pyruvate/2-oxoglutarate dehydrogenase complex dihydrolipoamide acyltransferase (E2) component
MDSKLAAFAARGDEPIAGTVAVGDGETFDVGEALDDGSGVIVVVSGSRLEYALSYYPALESVKVPDGAEPINADDVAPQVRASQAARDRAAELGVDLSEVEGTGASGAIKVSDVEDAAEAAGAGTDSEEDDS